MSTERVKVATSTELDEHGSRVIVDVDGREICIFNIDGEFHAVLNFCVHQSGPLCEGPLVGEMTTGPDRWEWSYSDEKYIMCPWHRWEFDVTTGVCAADERYRVPTYDLEQDGEDIYLKL